MVAASPAAALIVSSTNTNVAPQNDPGWNNHTIDGPNFVYLGDGWALTARHEASGAPGQVLQFSTGSYSVLANQNYVVHNPASVTNTSGQQVNLTAETDLRLVRLNGAPNLPSICVSSAACAISSTSPSLNGQVTFVGVGPGRQSTTTSWNSSWQEVPPNPGPVQYTGYYTNQDFVKRWGTNRVENVSSYLSSGSLLSSTSGVMKLQTPDGVTRDVITSFTKFDQSGDPNEVQAYFNDSGSSIFYNRGGTIVGGVPVGGTWELAGIVNAIFTYVNPNQPTSPGRVAFGNATTFSDLSYYRNSILDIINSNPYYALPGDINLDGVVNGGTSGGVPTGDVAAFVAGWGYDNGLQVGTYESWLNGDISRDGKTNVDDFLLLRTALIGGGSGSLSLASLLGGIGVPEPSGIVLVLAGAGWLAGLRRRR